MSIALFAALVSVTKRGIGCSQGFIVMVTGLIAIVDGCIELITKKRLEAIQHLKMAAAIAVVIVLQGMFYVMQ